MERRPGDLLLSKLQISYYPEPDSHIRTKVKLEPDLSNYAVKKELGNATGTDTSDLAAKKHFIALKGEVGKLDINKWVNVSTGLNDLDLERKVDKLDVGKLETVPKDLKKLSDVMDKEVVEKAVYNTLKTGTNCKIGTTINVGMSVKSKKRSCVKKIL